MPYVCPPGAWEEGPRGRRRFAAEGDQRCRNSRCSCGRPRRGPSRDATPAVRGARRGDGAHAAPVGPTRVGRLAGHDFLLLTRHRRAPWHRHTAPHCRSRNRTTTARAVAPRALVRCAFVRVHDKTVRRNHVRDASPGPARTRVVSMAGARGAPGPKEFPHLAARPARLWRPKSRVDILAPGVVVKALPTFVLPVSPTVP